VSDQPSQSEEPHLLYERDGHVAIVTMNRPAAKNALSGEMLVRMYDAWVDIDEDPEVYVGILTGAGGTFCSGMDLKAFAGGTQAQNNPFQKRMEEDGDLHWKALLRHFRPRKPLIAAVEGFALAGGCELAILSDFIVASETAVFGVPETTLGIFPGIGGTQLLPRIVGAPLAKELIFTGRRMRADEAKAAGLVNRLVAKGQARATATEIATTIAANGPVAVRQAKKAIAYGAETDLDTAMILAIEAYNATVVTEDRLEGVRAFNEKRKPQFKGK